MCGGRGEKRKEYGENREGKRPQIKAEAAALLMCIVEASSSNL